MIFVGQSQCLALYEACKEAHINSYFFNLKYHDSDNLILKKEYIPPVFISILGLEYAFLAYSLNCPISVTNITNWGGKYIDKSSVNHDFMLDDSDKVRDNCKIIPLNIIKKSVDLILKSSGADEEFLKKIKSKFENFYGSDVKFYNLPLIPVIPCPNDTFNIKNSLSVKLRKLVELKKKEICENLGITYLSPPKDSYDESELMRKDLILDLSHANILYGRILLKELINNKII